MCHTGSSRIPVVLRRLQIKIITYANAVHAGSTHRKCETIPRETYPRPIVKYNIIHTYCCIEYVYNIYMYIFVYYIVHARFSGFSRRRRYYYVPCVNPKTLYCTHESMTGNEALSEHDYCPRHLRPRPI